MLIELTINNHCYILVINCYITILIKKDHINAPVVGHLYSLDAYCVVDTFPTFCAAAFNAACLRTFARNVIEIIKEAAINPANT